MPINYEDWLRGTYQICNDPTEWNGENRKCNLCEMEAENMDEYSENHQRCIMCGDNDDCDCKDEWENKSNCCEATFHDPGYPDNDICSDCKEHAISCWQEAEETCNVNYAVKSVRELPQNNLFQEKNIINKNREK